MQRFGPPDQQYYYKKSDDAQPDDPESSQQTESMDIKGNVLFIRLLQDTVVEVQHQYL